MTWNIKIKGEKYIAEVLSDDLSNAILKADQWRSQGAEILRTFLQPRKRGFFSASDYFNQVRPREVNLALWLRDAFPSSVRFYQALTFYPALAYRVDYD